VNCHPEIPGKLPLQQEGEGIFRGLVKTWMEVMFSPSSFFSRVDPYQGNAIALLYAMLAGSLGIFLAIPALVALQRTSSLAEPTSLAEGNFFLTWLGFIVLSPLAVLVGTVLATGIFHLSVILFGGKRKIGATLQVIAYSSSADLLQAIPLIGGFISFLYKIPLFVIGFRQTHQISTPRALGATLLPYFLILIFIAIAIGMAVGLGFEILKELIPGKEIIT